MSKALDFAGEGTITGWIRKNKVFWNNGNKFTIIDLRNNSGSILLHKDIDNKIKLLHEGKGLPSSYIEVDCSDFSKDKDYFFAVTWSKQNSMTQLFINGKLVDEKKYGK